MTEKAPIPLESASQKAYFKWVDIKAKTDWRYLNIVSTLNGAYLKGGARGWNALKALGARKGFPDIIVAYPRGKIHGLFIEQKRLGQKASVEQLAWGNRLQMVGYAWQLSFSTEQSMEITEKWMGPLLST